ncbi:MAG: 4-hydroxy-tetrahydrodipicolinate synthase [Hyphomicrobiales bacterium]
MSDTRDIFQGVGVALITPFRGGALDAGALAALTSRLAAAGVRAFYPCGCTGEATSLTREERALAIRTVREAAGSGAAVVAGTGTASTEETIDLSREAIRLGADAVMVITPYSCRPTQEGIVAHYRAVADAIDRPIVLYNVPSRTGTNVLPETVVRLAEHPRIAAIKEASGSVDQATAIVARSDIAVLAGDDSLYLPLLAVGARGLVSVAGHVVPGDLVAMTEHARAGRAADAAAIHRRLHPLFRALFLETNPAPLKHALETLGLAPGELRLPLVAVRPETARQIEATLERLGLAAPARAAR